MSDGQYESRRYVSIYDYHILVSARSVTTVIMAIIYWLVPAL